MLLGTQVLLPGLLAYPHCCSQVVQSLQEPGLEGVLTAAVFHCSFQQHALPCSEDLEASLGLGKAVAGSQLAKVWAEQLGEL